MQECSTELCLLAQGALHQPWGTRALESFLGLGLESFMLVRVWVWRASCLQRWTASSQRCRTG